MDIEKTEEIETVLDSLPDASPKHTVQAILQVPMQQRAHLQQNIEKMRISVENETRRASNASHKKSELENQIREDEIDNQTITVFDNFRKFINMYTEVERFFHNVLIPSVSQGYLLDSKFHMRADRLGLSSSIKVSVDSHLKPDSFESLHMHDFIDLVAGLGNSYGETLISKTPGKTERHPMEDSSYFGMTPSSQPNWQDPQ
jgi:hypothetical protein